MTNTKTMSDAEVKSRLDDGDAKKIDDKLDELDVTKDSAGNDQRDKPDTEGSDSSSKS